MSVSLLWLLLLLLWLLLSRRVVQHGERLRRRDLAGSDFLGSDRISDRWPRGDSAHKNNPNKTNERWEEEEEEGRRRKEEGRRKG